MIKKFAALFATLGLAVGLLAGCGSDDGSASKGGSDSKSKDFVPKELTIGFVPSQNAETLTARAKPLAKLLEKRVGIPVKVKVTTNYSGVVEAMGSKQLDLGFLPPTDYVIAHKKGYADVLLQAQRFGVNPKDGTNTADKVDFYYAGLLVKNDSGIKDLKDLKGKKIGWQSPTSSAGYVWPAVEMKEHGVDPVKDVEGVQLQGHDKGVTALLNGDVDAAAVFIDARNIVKGEHPDIFKNTHYLYTTEKIPNDTISVRPDMSQKWKDKIAKAFIDIGKDPEGEKIIEAIYTHVGYVKSDDSKFDKVRDYSEKVKNLNE